MAQFNGVLGVIPREDLELKTEVLELRQALKDTRRERDELERERNEAWRHKHVLQADIEAAETARDAALEREGELRKLCERAWNAKKSGRSFSQWMEGQPDPVARAALTIPESQEEQ